MVIRTHHDSQDILPNGMADFIAGKLRPSGEAAIAIGAPWSKTWRLNKPQETYQVTSGLIEVELKIDMGPMCWNNEMCQTKSD